MDNCLFLDLVKCSLPRGKSHRGKGEKCKGEKSQRAVLLASQKKGFHQKPLCI